MTIAQMQDAIRALKKEKNVCILAHAYQSEEIWEVADFIGDSYGLSKEAAATDAKTVVMCGVRFMAETVKILAPKKRVFLANPAALCPMAEQLDADDVIQLREKYPGYAVVAYINTTAAMKTQCDVCVTSSSAVKIIKAMPDDKILFIPDCNLGDYVSKQVPEKTFAFVRGGCPTHLRITASDVDRAKAAHPAAKVLVHPECHPSVTAKADYAGSTTGILERAGQGDAEEYIIGTDNSIVAHLQYRYPDKGFYALSKDCECHNMRATTLGDLYRCLLGKGGEEIVMSDELIASAKKPMDAMLAYGG